MLYCDAVFKFFDTTASRVIWLLRVESLGPCSIPRLKALSLPLVDRTGQSDVTGSFNPAALAHCALLRLCHVSLSRFQEAAVAYDAEAIRVFGHDHPPLNLPVSGDSVHDSKNNLETGALLLSLR